MVRVVRIGITLGLLLAVCGCQSERRPSSPVRTEPQPPVVKTPQAGPDEVKPAVKLALRFVPGPAGTYRAVLEQGKSVSWHGPESTKPDGFEDGHTDNRTEITFGQEVLSVDPAGDAVAQITITALKYFNRVHNKVGLDFDSARQADQDNPLAKLIGRSYQIKLSRRGDVLGIVEVAQARSAISATSPAYQIVERMLSDDGIRERHTITALTALQKDPVSLGQSWSSEKSFSFSWMGSKSFERIYTLRDVSESDGVRLATIEMKAIPAAGQPQQGLPAVGPFAGAFDNTSNYDGRCVFELANGRIRECTEQMRSEWVMMDPEAVQSGTVPRAVKMAASWSRQLELVK